MTGEPGADELRIRSLLVARGVGSDAIPAKPVVPPRPTVRPRDWLDDLIDTDTDTDTDTAPAAGKAPEPEPKPRKSSPRIPDWWRNKPDRLPNPDDVIEEDSEPDAEEAPEPEQPDQEEPSAETTTTKPKAGRPKRRNRPMPGQPRAAWDSRPPSPRQSLADAWGHVPPRLKWLAYHAAAAAAGWPLGWVDWSTDTAAWYAAGHWLTPSACVLYGLGVVVLALYRGSRRWVWLAAWAAAVPVSSVAFGVLLYGTGYHS